MGKLGIPKNTIVKDGNEIILKKDLFDFKSSFLPFSDLMVCYAL